MKTIEELAKMGAKLAGEEEVNLDAMTGEVEPPKKSPAKGDPLAPENWKSMMKKAMDKQASDPVMQAHKEHLERKAYVEKRTYLRKFDMEKKLEADEQKVAQASKEAFNDIFATYSDQIKSRHGKEIVQHTNAIAHAVPFIDPVFDSYFKLTPGQFVTVAAYSGDGKSTNAANIAAEAVRKGKRAIILSNEERSTDFMDMVACISEGLYHKEFVDRTMAAEDQKRVVRKVHSLMKEKQFISLDEADTNGGTTKDDYMLNTLTFLAEASVKPDVVVIDYLTNIYATGSTNSDNHYFQLARFLNNMKNLINKLPFPVVMCAQMHSEDKKKGSKGKPASLDTRLIMGGDVFRCSTVVLEVKPDFNTKVSTFTIHKNRTYKEKGVIDLKFDKGRLIHFDPTGVYQAPAGEDSTND